MIKNIIFDTIVYINKLVPESERFAEIIIKITGHVLISDTAKRNFFFVAYCIILIEKTHCTEENKSRHKSHNIYCFKNLFFHIMHRLEPEINERIV